MKALVALAYLSFFSTTFCVSDGIDLTEDKRPEGDGDEIARYRQNSAYRKVIDSAVLEEMSKGSKSVISFDMNHNALCHKDPDID